MSRSLYPLLLIFPLIAGCAARSSLSTLGQSAIQGALVHLPGDQAAHPHSANEWWYLVGHMRAGARTFGYEVTAFRFSHVHVPGAAAGAPALTLFRTDVAITDEANKRFHQRVTYYFPQSASMSTTSLGVNVGSVSLRGSTPQNMVVRASLPGGSIALRLRSQRAVMNVGGRGYLQFGRGFTYYYSLTDVEATGTIQLGARTYRVRGVSWLDHQWGDWSWATITGWTWMALQLDNGVQLSFFDFRGGKGRVRSASILQANGKLRVVHDVTIAARGSWRSPHTGGRYPSSWTVRIPEVQAVLQVKPTVTDQELVAPNQPQGSYWEGSGRASGTYGGKRVTALTYTELTGFAGMRR